jgi:hypothetical protein
MACKLIPGGFVCGPSPQEIRKTGRRKRKWCFTCRKRVMAIEHIVDQEWYDLEIFYRCPNFKEGGLGHSLDFPS